MRRTLSDEELRAEVLALIGKGHKRLVIDFGEHPDYSAEVIAHAVEVIYATKAGNGEIRRVNVNCVPLDVEGYRLMKAVGIGTYQIFQETLPPADLCGHASARPQGRLPLAPLRPGPRHGGGCDDVGLGALFGLYDWRFEALGLLAHAIHLEERFGVGPHTFSFPRIKDASNRAFDAAWAVSDARVQASDRHPAPLGALHRHDPHGPRAGRRCGARCIDFGVSQIDGGTRIEIGGYSKEAGAQDLDARAAVDLRDAEVDERAPQRRRFARREDHAGVDTERRRMAIRRLKSASLTAQVASKARLLASFMRGKEKVLGPKAFLEVDRVGAQAERLEAPVVEAEEGGGPTSSQPPSMARSWP